MSISRTRYGNNLSYRYDHFGTVEPVRERLSGRGRHNGSANDLLRGLPNLPGSRSFTTAIPFVGYAAVRHRQPPDSAIHAASAAARFRSTGAIRLAGCHSELKRDLNARVNDWHPFALYRPSTVSPEDLKRQNGFVADDMPLGDVSLDTHDDDVQRGKDTVDGAGFLGTFRGEDTARQKMNAGGKDGYNSTSPTDGFAHHASAHDACPLLALASPNTRANVAALMRAAIAFTYS